jgi:hypothetical protein
VAVVRPDTYEAPIGVTSRIAALDGTTDGTGYTATFAATMCAESKKLKQPLNCIVMMTSCYTAYNSSPANLGYITKHDGQ